MNVTRTHLATLVRIEEGPQRVERGVELGELHDKSPSIERTKDKARDSRRKADGVYNEKAQDKVKILLKSDSGTCSHNLQAEIEIKVSRLSWLVVFRC